jgi:photosystem II stability/assembly factor-like uncharacterized protein
MNKLQLYILFFTLLITGINCRSKQKNSDLHSPKQAISFTKLSSYEWLPIGPFGSPTPMADTGQISPHGCGRFLSLYINPSNENEIIAGHATSGIFKSKDGGKTWEQKLKFPYATGINKIIKIPETNQLLAASGLDIGNSRQYGFGIFQSSDNGETWQANSLQFTPIEYQQEQARDLCHITLNNSTQTLCISNKNIYASDNAGLRWRNVFKSKYDLKQLVNNPFNVQELLAFGSGILLSRDAGKTWEDLSETINSEIGQLGLGAMNNRFSASFSQKNKGKLSIFVQANQSYFVIYDLLTKKIIYKNSAPQIIPNKSRQVQTTVYDKKNNIERLLIGTTRLFVSNNEGQDFSVITTPEIGKTNHIHDDINALLYQNQTLYCATDGGIDKSDDYGQTWTSLTHYSNINSTLIFGFDLNKNGQIMCGTQDNGIFIYQNKEWYCTKMYGDGGRCIATADSNWFYAGFAQMCYQTKDGGKTFQYAHAGNERSGFDFKMNYHQESNHFYLSNLNLYLRNKEQRYEILTSNLKADRKIKAFWVNPNNSNEIWIGKDDATWGGKLENKLLFTNDGGANWQDFTEQLPILKWRSITDIAVNETGEIAVTLVSFDQNSTDLNKVYISSDNGQTFTNQSKGLPNLPSTCIMSVKGKWIYGDNSGVYEFNDLQWVPLGEGFPPTIVTEIKYFEKEQALIVSTFGRGLWAIRY